MKTVRIGKQDWMCENLNVDHYQNGDLIPEVKDAGEWESLKSGAWCYYNNDPDNGRKYGKLYNWYAINDPRRLAPEGCHIPEYVEFLKLTETVNKNSNALKIVNLGSRWHSSNNLSGFSSLMSGRRIHNGTFHDKGSSSYLWSSTEFGPLNANSLNFYSDEDTNIYKIPYEKTFGFSVRCLRDQEPVYTIQHTEMSYENIKNWESDMGNENQIINSTRKEKIISVQVSL